MHLSKIAIENFRGIKHAEFEFDPEITVLIGENNAGKTSVLDALSLCLDIVKSDKTCNFSDFDFFRDESRMELATCEPICITLSFLESEEYLWPVHIRQVLNEVIVGDEYSAIKLRVTAKFDAETGGPIQNWSFLDDADNELVGREMMIKELRRLRPFFFQTALRAAKDQFHGQSTYWASFLRNRDIDETTQRALEEELYNVNQKIVNAHTSFKEVTEEVKRISDIVTVGQKDVVTVDPVPADVYKALRYTRVNLQTMSNAKIPIRSHGEGTQSLSILLLFSAYLKRRLQTDVDKNAEPIIAIEEPEAHLHPNAIRAVWHLLRDMPGQKIVATHSGDILSEVPVSNLRRMNRNGSAIQCKSIPDGLLDKEELRKFNHHVRRNRGELLFANNWVLVEGETDVFVFTECADLLSIDLYAQGTRFVEYSQAGGPGIFIKVADALGIRWHVIADNDTQGEKDIQAAKLLLAGRQEASFISALPYKNIEILLCSSGYGQPYRKGVTWKKEAELQGLEFNSPEYWEKVVQIVSRKQGFSKPAAAMEAVLGMREQGKNGVPPEVKAILEKVCLSVGRTT